MRYLSVFVFAFAFGFFINDMILNNIYVPMDRADFDKCELELPRNQHCVVIAVPIAKGIK